MPELKSKRRRGHPAARSQRARAKTPRDDGKPQWRSLD
jgi:hypothetical protein